MTERKKMQAEKYFQRLIYIDQRISADMDEVERLKAMASCIPSPSIEENINGKGERHSRVENLVERLDDLQHKIYDEVDELVDLKAEAQKVLCRIENQTQRLVLQEYYFNMKRMERIASDLYMSYRRVQQVKKEGLAAAQPIIDAMCEKTA